MCGIGGIALTAGSVEVGIAATLGAALAHRGPDDEGYLGWDLSTPPQRSRDPAVIRGAAVALVHRRLAIIDPGPAGWQPMASADGRHHLVFNGEIYNYRELRATLAGLGQVFVSSSDTEVLLAAYRQWGADCLHRLTGMFAFAILDIRTRSLFLARDRFGIKPLYYAVWRGGLAFASEIKALLGLPGMTREASPQRVYEYLCDDVKDYGADTFFRDVQQLPPAHCAVIPIDSPARVDPECYWRLDLASTSDLSFAEAARRLRQLFLDSMILHLRSDVPIGVALSGGIDSSSVTLAMRHLMGPARELHAFGFVARDAPRINEERWIDQAAGAAGAILHKVEAGAGDLRAYIDCVITALDEPFSSTTLLAQWLVYRRMRECGIKVTLDGQGADEQLAGYPTYLGSRLASLVRARRWARAWRLLQSAAAGRGVPMQTLLLGLADWQIPASLKLRVWRLLGDRAFPAWLNRAWLREHAIDDRPLYDNDAGLTMRSHLAQTFTRTILPELLRYEDRTSMAHSVESRVPFLHTELVEFLYTLPEDYLIDDRGRSKCVFRQAMRGLVPEAILDRRDKIGFQTPQPHWLRLARDWAADTIGEASIAHATPLDPRALRRMRAGLAAGRQCQGATVWRILNLLRWAELYSVRF